LVVPSINRHYVEWRAAQLGAQIPLRVIAAEDGQVPAQGWVYVASDVPSLRIAQGRLRFEREENDFVNRRVKDALFCSMAWDQGSGALAVILAGMGPDGALGMKEIRNAGGHTIVQDSSTTLVNGTIKLAVKMNAACESLHPQEIAPRLVSLAANSPPNLK
jgi:chemotaxis response regulator CheB